MVMDNEEDVLRIPGTEKDNHRGRNLDARIKDILKTKSEMGNEEFSRKCYWLLYDFGNSYEFPTYVKTLNNTDSTKTPFLGNKNEGIEVKGKSRFYDSTVVEFFDGKEYYLSNDLGSNKKWKLFDFILKWVGKTEEERNNIKSQFNEETSNNLSTSGDNTEKSTSKGTNLIIYGAPGTGKSYYVENEMGLDKDKITRVVFHPEYTYFDFVGQYRPYPLYDKTDNKLSSMEGNESDKPVPYIDYRFVPGPFTKVLVEAYKDKNNMYTLLIEELNRADAPAVFGEVFQLLDRKDDGESEYGIVPSAEWGAYLKSQCDNIVVDGKIKIPKNMNIIATMNSADQGVHVLDTAFKRRWEYEFMSVNNFKDPNKRFEIKVKYNNNNDHSLEWEKILRQINDKLIKMGINEDRLIGPYFVSLEQIKQCKDNYPTEAYKKILFYLWDDVLRNNGRSEFFGEKYKSITELFAAVDTKENVFGIEISSDSDSIQSDNADGDENDEDQTTEE